MTWLLYCAGTATDCFNIISCRFYKSNCQTLNDISMFTYRNYVMM